MTRFWHAASLVFAVGCGGVARTNVGELCTPGQQAECDCAGHSKGIRTCTAEGVGYGECSCSGSTDDGGSTDVGGGTPSPVCASKSAWTNGLQSSPEMTPGRACIACHSTTSVPLTVAGTIFVDLHEPDDCYGVDGLGVAVALLDDSGVEFAPRLQVNRAGNFYTSKAMPPTYRVKIIAGGRESVMMAQVSDGDCNSCHAAAGVAGTRGRLMKP